MSRVLMAESPSGFIVEAPRPLPRHLEGLSVHRMLNQVACTKVQDSTNDSRGGVHRLVSMVPLTNVVNALRTTRMSLESAI